ncbi:MAG TPA: UDP-N-acetylmuramoyl-L-alanine--D-glutamate ligase [Candidatus Paceibacterota bacterium]
MGRTANLSGSRVAILGFGTTGQTAARWLLDQDASVVAYDAKREPDFPEALLATLRSTGSFEFVGGASPFPTDIKDADFAIVSPGIKPKEPALGALREAGIPTETDLSLFLRLWRGGAEHPALGVTGANGKSTIVSLVAHVLAESGAPAVAVGNVGASPLPLLDAGERERAVPVIEMSCYQLEYHPSDAPMPLAAVIANLSPNHLDRHGDMDGYAEAKCRIAGPECRGVAVDADDRGVLERVLPRLTKREVPVWAVTRRSATVPNAAATINVERSGRVSISRGSGEPREVLPAGSLAPSLLSPHNLTNVGLAVGLLDVGGLLAKVKPRAFASFQSLPHRVELVAERGGVRYVDDSKATSPAAALAAFAATPGDIVWITGGGDKGMEYGELADAVCRRVRAAVLVPGSAGAKLRGLLAGAGVSKVVEVEDVVESVAAASALAQPGDTVLLSPGTSASGAGYRSFEQRGELFAEAARALPA